MAARCPLNELRLEAANRNDKADQNLFRRAFLKAISRSFFLLRDSSGKRYRRWWPRPAGPKCHEVPHLQDSVLPRQHQGSRPGQDGRGADLLLQRRRLQSVGSHQEVRAKGRETFFHAFIFSTCVLCTFWFAEAEPNVSR